MKGSVSYYQEVLIFKKKKNATWKWPAGSHKITK